MGHGIHDLRARLLTDAVAFSSARILATRSDIRLALDAGFSPGEIDYMLDLPDGATIRAVEIRHPESLASAA